MKTMFPVTVAVALAVALVAARQGDNAPTASIKGGDVRAVLFVPDAKTGYYQGTRFDWAGSISSLTWKDHSYFGKWFDAYDPKGHDAIMGPVEEFTGLGYDEVAVGEPFVRIGVGAVRKPEEPAYGQFKTYDIIDPGTRSVDGGTDWIEFTHTLGNTSGYAYTYRKRIQLSGHTLVLEHRLRNEGRKPITTSVYEHDFFMLDNRPTGPDTVIRFPFPVTATGTLDGLIETRGTEVVYLRELQGTQALHTELKGYGSKVSDYDIRVENRKTGAGVRQTSDRPLAKLVLWSPRSTVCPEAYVDVSVAPGKETSWRIIYDFYEVQAGK
jgi:hypothetical protein